MNDAAASGATDPVLARFLINSTIQQLDRADKRGSHALADAAGVSRRTWDRWTNGQNTEWRQPQIVAAMGAFGYARNDAATAQLLQMAADARKNNVVARPEWVRETAFDLLVAIEQVSEEVRTYENTLMPGLLQTADYTRAYLAARPDGSDIEEYVRVRVERQRILTRTDGPVRYTALIDESVLHRSPGDDSAVMRGQLTHLLDLAAQPNITIRVIPFAAGPYGTDGNGPFVILDSELVGRRITYVETSAAATYYETPEANQRYADGWARLMEWTLAPEESVDAIHSLRHDA